MTLKRSLTKKPCKFCGQHTHYPYQCFQNPNRKKWAIKQEGKEAKKWKIVKSVWYAQNPPSKDGYYYCALRISPMCLIRMTPAQTTLDHIIPRSNFRNRAGRHNLDNLQPTCSWCNTLKGSKH